MDTKAELYRRLFEKYGDNLDPQLFDSSDIEQQKMGIASEMRKDQSSNAMAQSLAGAMRGFGSVRGKMPETNIKNYLTSENPEYKAEMGGLDRKEKVRDYLMGKYFDVKQAAAKNSQEEWKPVGLNSQGNVVSINPKTGEERTGTTKVSSSIGQAGKPSTEKLGTVEKTQISNLAGKIANQTSIINSIDSAKKLYDQALADGREEEALTIGLGMLKTLNSDQGPDAIGNAEADRLAPYLTYQMGNFTGAGKFVGRDLQAFSKQLESTSARMKDSVSRGQAQLDQLGSGEKVTFKKDDSNNEKIVNGKKYKKVQGGWQEIP